MRLFSLALAAAAALLLAAETRADSAAGAPASAPSAHLAAAQRLYQKLDLDAALAELQQAELAAKDNDDETAQVLIYRGLIFSETNKTAEANDQFKRALAIRPWAEVPSDTSPRIARMFSDARKSIWGMASVKPPQKKATAAPASTTPASTTPASTTPASTTPASTTPAPTTPAPTTPAPPAAPAK